MIKQILGACALVVVTSAALAEDGAVTGAAGGAVTGAIVGGPVGAAVGGVAGAVAGAALDPAPEEVRTYVTQQSVPSVRVQKQVVVGEALPETVQIRTVPDNSRYGYTVVNERRVIVDPQTRTVVQVID